MRIFPALLTTLTLAGTALLAACSGDDDDTSPTPEASPTPQLPTSTSLLLGENCRVSIGATYSDSFSAVCGDTFIPYPYQSVACGDSWKISGAARPLTKSLCFSVSPSHDLKAFQYDKSGTITVGYMDPETQTCASSPATMTYPEQFAINPNGTTEEKDCAALGGNWLVKLEESAWYFVFDRTKTDPSHSTVEMLGLGVDTSNLGGITIPVGTPAP